MLAFAFPGVDGDSVRLSDMLLVLLVPAVIGILTSNTDWFYNWLGRVKQSLRREYVRYIVHIQSSDYYFMLKQDNRNNILQKAISLYVGELQDKEKYQSGQFRLMRVDDSTDENKCWTEKMDHNRGSTELKKFCVKTLPQVKKWTEVEKGIWFHHSEVPDDAPAGQERMIHTIALKTYRRNGYEAIDKFIEKCYKQYIEMLRKEMDQGRYLYQLQVGAKGGDSDSNSGGASKMLFKKYRLTDDKAFDSLYFPEKKDVIALVDDFVKRRGKFSIEGFPNKLGLLLHGPPGTGKTSFVKALSHYTDRHIVSVPLSKLKTNQELYDIMFDRVFPCREDDGVPQRLDFDKVIFLMEDVDAATDIVKARARAQAAPSEEMKAMLK
jgi:mitochondrial chaperone BCS1